MIYTGIGTDRLKLVRLLEHELSCRAVYLGAPTFLYRVGAYEVLRDGDVRVPNSECSAHIADEMKAQQLIKGAAEPNGHRFWLPHVNAYMNLLALLASHQLLINKTLRKTRQFLIRKSFMKEMLAENPNSVQEFMEAYQRNDGFAGVKGLCFTSRSVIFKPLHSENEDLKHAYLDLITHLVATAKRVHWIKASRIKPVNEKYSFRIWLYYLGMSGSDYARSREVLLEVLSGNAAYRTPEQRERALAKQKKRRKRRRRVCHRR